MKDEFYNKHLIKNSVFKPIIQMLSETEKRNNLLNSACLELFVFIRVVSYFLFFIFYILIKKKKKKKKKKKDKNKNKK